MKYVVLMYQDERVWAGLTEAERDDYLAAHIRFAHAVQTRATMIAGEALAGVGTATTLRHEADRPLLTDGPFAETAEQLGGFYLVDAPDLDVVTALCQELPHGYTVEIRPVIDVSDQMDPSEQQWEPSPR